MSRVWHKSVTAYSQGPVSRMWHRSVTTYSQGGSIAPRSGKRSGGQLEARQWARERRPGVTETEAAPVENFFSGMDLRQRKR